MTFPDLGDGRSNGSEVREAAREKAKSLRALQRKQEKRRHLLVRFGIVAGILVALAIVTVVLVMTNRSGRPGPLNMLSDGIKIGEGYKAVPTAALEADAAPVPNPRVTTSDVIDVQIYVDYANIYAEKFVAANSSQLQSFLTKGAATVEVHPISILDSNSQGTQYSTRSANAAACVANYAPNSYWAASKELFAEQPKERAPGLTDDQLIAAMKKANVTDQSEIANCIRDQRFKTWVKAATLRALAGPIPNSNVTKVAGTPTVIVNGLKYKGAPGDADAFQAFFLQAAGAAFNENATATPTPTPTPTATPTTKPRKHRKP
jgi:protein-disulfide isomerase